MDGYIMYKGWLWPQGDVHARRAIIDKASWKDIDRVLPYVEQRRTVVQAGGHCGVWASKLTRHFASVYTFEPDPKNFVALTANTARHEGRVHRYQAALGCERKHIAMVRDKASNTGAFHVGWGTVDDTTPTLLLDDLALNHVDLIILDVEGFEVNALKGAADTLLRCHPVVMMEDKGLDAKHHGIKAGAAVELLQDLGYEVKEKVARDVIMVPPRA
jgi:FkbM family methyltransferase